MRPQQQNRRMRGRGNNNRKGPNPLTRSFESNGPDVKIRGTAQQIADKYAALARDAQSSGDRVMAENYLQHAEHYNRIIAAAQAQQQQQQSLRERSDDADDLTEDRDDLDAAAEPASRENRNGSRVNDGSGPQPVIEGMPAEIALKDGTEDRHSGNGQYRNGNGDDRTASEAGETASANADSAADGDAASRETASEDADAAPRRPRRPRRAARSRASEEDAGDDAPAARDSSRQG